MNVKGRLCTLRNSPQISLHSHERRWCPDRDAEAVYESLEVAFVEASTERECLEPLGYGPNSSPVAFPLISEREHRVPLGDGANDVKRDVPQNDGGRLGVERVVARNSSTWFRRW